VTTRSRHRKVGRCRIGVKPLLLALGLVLTGCSSTQFAYNQLDTIILWKTGDYVDLTSAQRTWLRSEINALLDWHRKEELPQYSHFLAQAELSLDAPLTERRVAALRIPIDRALDRLQIRIYDLLFRGAPLLTAEQTEDLMTTLRNDQDDLERELLARDERQYRADTYARLESQMSRVLGRLSPDQRAHLEQASSDIVRIDHLWLRDRSRWQMDLEQMIAAQPTEWPIAASAYFNGNNTLSSPEYQALWQSNTQVITRASVAVLTQRSARQDRHLRRWLSDLREDFDALVANSVQ
jgi:hypothetical protein